MNHIDPNCQLAEIRSRMMAIINANPGKGGNALRKIPAYASLAALHRHVLHDANPAIKSAWEALRAGE